LVLEQLSKPKIRLFIINRFKHLSAGLENGKEFGAILTIYIQSTPNLSI